MSNTDKEFDKETARCQIEEQVKDIKIVRQTRCGRK